VSVQQLHGAVEEKEGAEGPKRTGTTSAPNPMLNGMPALRYGISNRRGCGTASTARDAAMVVGGTPR